MNRLAVSALPLLLLLGVTLLSSFGGKKETIESVTANPAYNKVMPVGNVGYAEYHRQVTARLEYLEELLRGRDVSAWPEELRAERAKNIERLHAYRLQGKFPINYDYPDRQLPCFLDRDGNLCAVANLIAQSSGMELVRQINGRYQYATVSQMKMPELTAWVAQSGLTVAEVITIQEPGSFHEPGFKGSPEPVIALEPNSLHAIPQLDTAMMALQQNAFLPEQQNVLTVNDSIAMGRGLLQAR